MRPEENYTPFVSVAFGLTVAILGIFQIYFWREPMRIQRDEERDRLAAIEAGHELFVEHCASCHGEDGEGDFGPPLNSKELLGLAPDDLLLSLTRTGIPGTFMPAWGQVFGGPLTDEQLSQLVTFMRSWEPDAPVLEPVVEEPDPLRGAAIYNQTCFVCHGDNGEGTDSAPALNDQERLSKLDNAWYRNTIAHGRPAKGMPTWGTVLSPAQINDVVALMAAWREGETVAPTIPLANLVTNALFALREFDRLDAIFYLEAAQEVAESDQTPEIQAVIALIEENHLFEAQSLLMAFLPPQEMGRALFDTNCAACHGDDGSGGMGSILRGNVFIQAKTDEEIVDFILTGRRGTAMDGFEGILGPEEAQNIVALMRSWQE